MGLIGIILWAIGFIIFGVSLVCIIKAMKKSRDATEAIVYMWVGTGMVWIGAILICLCF